MDEATNMGTKDQNKHLKTRSWHRESMKARFSEM